MTLSIFDGVTDQWWSPVHNHVTEELDRAARRALAGSGKAQGVHGHAEGLPCTRGLCYVIKYPTRTDGGS